MYLGMIDSN